jgi:hypothetical protein
LRVISKSFVKQFAGKLPLAPEVYWMLRQQGKAPYKFFSLQPLEKRLPVLRAQAISAAHNGGGQAELTGRRVLLFSMLRKWVEHAALFGMALGGLGNEATLLYLPYAQWEHQLNEFDQRRQNAYTRKVLSKTAPVLTSVSMLDIPDSQVRKAHQSLPASLVTALQEVALRDAQYTLQIEEFDIEGESASARLYRNRLARNLYAASALLAWISALPPKRRPEVILTPNGSILEMGAVYQVARFLEIPVVTYEFGEQGERIWLARNAEVMHQDTDELWQAVQDLPLNENQWEQIRSLYAARQNARLWENFTRLWQGTPSQGGEQVRQALQLDDRPVVLLAANVICDSLTLGRQIFTQTMTEWLQHTAQGFVTRNDVQLVIRIHPGERYAKGPSVAEVVKAALPEIPPHIHLVQALDPINTYDIIQIADVGLAYTTTVGMEMAMSGVPVILGGYTHYRAKGFTFDPDSWESFNSILDQVLADPAQQRLSRVQVERAWQYAYRFFFDYPCPFPWHYQRVWKTLETWPMERVLSLEGLAAFGDTFSYLLGGTRQYSG